MTVRIFRGRRVLLPSGTSSASIHVRNGQIARVAEYTDIPEGAAVEDFGDLVMMPGIVDTHVHINEPGRTEWEGFETATRAAAAGGVTTLMDMPLNSIPPTTTRAGFDAKAEAANGKLFVDVVLAGGVV
ncbi:MAG: amidohydrolase family protein, partial [Polyangiaceae bacterium]